MVQNFKDRFSSDKAHIGHVSFYSIEKANGDSCSSSEECLVSDAICNGGICGCPTNMFLQGMTCLNSKYLDRKVTGSILTWGAVLCP